MCSSDLGAVAKYVSGHEMALIAPPSQAIANPQALAGMTLLHHVSVPQAWAQWASAHHVSNINPRAGPQLDQFHSLIRAVMAGMGVALVPHCLVKDDIAAGLVSAPLSSSNLDGDCYGGYMADTGYYLCYPEARSHLLPLTHFRDWLLASG